MHAIKDMKRYLFALLFVCSLLFAEDEKKLPIVVSIPKSGGHFSLKMLTLFPKEVQFEWADHLTAGGAHHPLLDDVQAQKVLIVRDLRDVFVSLVYWFDAQIKEGMINKHVATKIKGLRDIIQHWRTLSFDEKLKIVLEDGEESLYQSGFMRENIEAALQLLEKENVQMIRFEDLIGPQGGGTATAQADCIKRFASLFRLDLSETQIQEIGKKTFGKTHPSKFDRTFHKGKIGEWKSHYNDKNLLLFYMRYGRYQKAFGYIE
jgi:hypothetical protein